MSSGVITLSTDNRQSNVPCAMRLSQRPCLYVKWIGFKTNSTAMINNWIASLRDLRTMPQGSDSCKALFLMRLHARVLMLLWLSVQLLT